MLFDINKKNDSDLAKTVKIPIYRNAAAVYKKRFHPETSEWNQ
jgi:hypothetical protein